MSGRVAWCLGCREVVSMAGLWSDGDAHTVEVRNGHGDDYQESCGPVRLVDDAERLALELMPREGRE